MRASVRFEHDPASWDSLVLSLGGKLLQSWRWGAFKQRHGWQPVRVAVHCQEARLAAQILVRRVFGFSVLYIPRGPLVDRPDDLLSATFRDAIHRIARRYRAITVIAEPETEVGVQLLDRLGWSPSPVVIQPHRTIRVELASDETLLARMKPKTRYNIRLALRRGVTTRLATAADLPIFYDLLTETALRDGFGIHDITYFQDLLACFGEDCALILAEFEHQPAASALVVRFGDEAVYLYGASRTALQRHMPAYAVQWAALRWARERGCRWYDFWGIPNTDEPPEDGENLNVRSGLWGVYRFKAGFGGEPYTYPGTREWARYRLFVWLWRRVRGFGSSSDGQLGRTPE